MKNYSIAKKTFGKCLTDYCVDAKIYFYLHDNGSV